MILDCVVRPSWQLVGDLGPTVAELVVRLEQDVLFGLSPGSLDDGRVELVVPSLATLRQLGK